MWKRRLLLILMGTPLLAVGPDTDWIARLGGKVGRDPAGRIVAVNLRGSWISDVEMIELARMPDLERLDLSHTRISDEGMLNLKPAPKIKELKLFYSEWITDQGMTAIKGWKHLKRLDNKVAAADIAVLNPLHRFIKNDAEHFRQSKTSRMPAMNREPRACAEMSASYERPALQFRTIFKRLPERVATRHRRTQSRNKKPRRSLGSKSAGPEQRRGRWRRFACGYENMIPG